MPRTRVKKRNKIKGLRTNAVMWDDFSSAASANLWDGKQFVISTAPQNEAQRRWFESYQANQKAKVSFYDPAVAGYNKQFGIMLDNKVLGK